MIVVLVSLYGGHIGGAAGLFSMNGSTDTLLHAAAPAVGSVPNTKGYIAELLYLPWLNVKPQLQHAA